MILPPQKILKAKGPLHPPLASSKVYYFYDTYRHHFRLSDLDRNRPKPALVG